MFIEVHAIQNFAPANLNRDDTGNPKDCEFGGYRRARISSQCLKRAMRLSPVFAETTGVQVGTRTKWLIERCLRPPLVAAGKADDKITEVLTAFVPAFVSKLDTKSKDERKTAVLLYLSQAEVDAIVQALLDNWDSLPDDAKKLSRTLVKEHKNQTSAPDIALFGRMLAEQPQLGLDAACQVAHAISTHRVAMEMDFYTAVDDLKADDTAGAGMMGFTGFDSACFYRYARIDWGQLLENLSLDENPTEEEIVLARRTVEGFLRALVAAVPSGKQNAFAANNPPNFLLAIVRQDGMGWSLANAFERPIYSRDNSGLVAPSVAALDTYWGRLCQVYGDETLLHTAVLALDPDLPLKNLAGDLVETLDAWVNAVTDALSA